MGVYLNPGNRKFERAVSSQIYVDKSGMLALLNSVINKEKNCVCISRPRRFGKSMAANMITAYYGRGCDSKLLFDSLEIARNNAYEKHLNQYNVIALNMQDFASVSATIEEMVVQLQERVLDELKKTYSQVINSKERYLSFALEQVYAQLGEEFVFVIDEWDCIFRDDRYERDDFKQYLDFVRNLLKDKPYVALAYMTGILPIKKYGTHSALNMFDEYSMLDPGSYARYVGFTEEEVKNLCGKYDMDFHQMKYWYDGYSFGNACHICNPKSVVDSIDRQKFSNYWTQTETYEALRKYLDMNYDGLKETIVKMISGENCKIDPNTFQNDMHSFTSRDDVLTLLVHLGYLALDIDSMSVYVPNYELSDEFLRAVRSSAWVNVIDAVEQSAKLIEATINGDEEFVANCVDRCHEQNASILSYNDENSLSCVISLAYYKAMDEYVKIRELPTGKGFADIVFLPRANSAKPAIVVELKYDKDAKSAIDQIHEKNYPQVLKEFGGEIVLVGINYDKKTKKHTCRIENINLDK